MLWETEKARVEIFSRTMLATLIYKTYEHVRSVISQIYLHYHFYSFLFRLPILLLFWDEKVNLSSYEHVFKQSNFTYIFLISIPMEVSVLALHV